MSVPQSRAGGLVAFATFAVFMLPVCAPPVAADAALSTASRIGARGIGPIVIGTTPVQARATGTALTASAPAPGSTCYLVRPAAPHGVVFMVEHGTIRRVEVTTAAIATTDGFRVGDTLGKIETAYGARARRAAGKYDPRSQTVTIEPATSADANFRIIYVLLDGKVSAIRAGALPQVAYVEGCS